MGTKQNKIETMSWKTLVTKAPQIYAEVLGRGDSMQIVKNHNTTVRKLPNLNKKPPNATKF